jgi:fructose-1,6-bisphosphatase/inositol monophosphatase family enzyme
MVIRCASRDIKSECLQTLSYLLFVAKMALSTSHFTFSLTSWTNICVDIVKTIAKFHSFGNSALTIALVACHDIVGILCATSLTVWAGNLLLN